MSVSFYKVSVVVVFVKNTVHGQGTCFHHINCPVYYKQVALVLSKS